MNFRTVDAEAQRSHEHTTTVTETPENSRTSFAAYDLGTLEDRTIDLSLSPLLDQQE